MAKVYLHPKSGLVSAIVPRGHGSHTDRLLRRMKELGIPLTRQNYIDLATNLGELEWTCEHDANLPAGLIDEERA
jgi:hypothetical protein